MYILILVICVIVGLLIGYLSTSARRINWEKPEGFHKKKDDDMLDDLMEYDMSMDDDDDLFLE